MKLLLENKILALTVSLLLVMNIPNSHAEQSLTLVDIIVVVKKHVYNDPERTAQKTHAFQKQCTTAKEALYATTKHLSAAPKEGDYLSLEQIRQLHHVTVTEYFRGTDYARYEEGQTWDVSFQNNAQNKQKDEEFYCRIIPKKFTKGEIRTASESINFHQTGNDPGVVELRKMRPELLAMIKLPFMAKDLVMQKVKNSHVECLSKPDLPFCYLKEIPIHTGTKKVVVVESKHLAKGINKGADAIDEMVIGNLLAGFGDGTVFYAGDFAKIYENVSVAVGKEIPNKIFEIPDFAKGYQIIQK